MLACGCWHGLALLFCNLGLLLELFLAEQLGGVQSWSARGKLLSHVCPSIIGCIYTDHHGGKVRYSCSICSLLCCVCVATIDLEVLMQHVYHVLDPEDGTQRLILAHEAQADQAVPLDEVNGWGRVLGLDADH